jgi:hypothetical protein
MRPALAPSQSMVGLSRWAAFRGAMTAIALVAFSALAVGATAPSGLQAVALARLPQNGGEEESPVGQGTAFSPLLSVFGSEPFFCCTLGPVKSYVGEYVFQVDRDGTIQGAILFRDANLFPTDPPTSSYLFTATLKPADLQTLRDLVGSARLGVQGNCRGGAPFMRNGVDPRQRITWYGRANRTNTFALFEGDPCPPEVQSIMTLLETYSPEPIP